jgi:peptidyl-tRNA hydrolase, PTH1 family
MMGSDGFRGLIVGLGNPGKEFQLTPHNLGFLTLDELLVSHADQWRSMSSPIAKCNLWRGNVSGVKWLAAKPLTYMNRSGDVIGPLARWHKLDPEQILIIHDDLDLQPGVVKFKMGGGAAGHKGILSTIEALGTNAFARLRIGIGRPQAGFDPASYVLRKFSPEQTEIFTKALSLARKALVIYCTKGLEAGMQEIHTDQN